MTKIRGFAPDDSPIRKDVEGNGFDDIETMPTPSNVVSVTYWVEVLWAGRWEICVSKEGLSDFYNVEMAQDVMTYLQNESKSDTYRIVKVTKELI